LTNETAALVSVGSQSDIMIGKSIIKLKEGFGDREPCKDYGYEGYLNCVQEHVR
jgi:hypothetical protein